MKNAICFIFSILIVVFGNAQAITTAVPFLAIAPDAPAGGMGQTGVAGSPDVNSMHWNAAKLAFTDKKMGIGISYVPWLRALVPDINLAYISFYSKLDSLSTIGVSVRYFSMGNVTYSSGGTIGQYRPNEFAIDGCYSRRLSNHFSVGIAGRYIRSNNGIIIGTGIGAATDFSVDLGGYYHNEKNIFGKKSIIMSGIAMTNMGPKISYSSSVYRDFLPTNLRIGEGIKIDLDQVNQIGLQCELSKLLVPTPPYYALDSNGYPVINPNNGQYVVLDGKDPNVSAAKGMLQSFYDAPGGLQGELREVTAAVGAEYWYNKIFAIRAGYFYESKTKGNRQFLTLGAGVRYNVFGLDFAYLIPTNGQRSELQNTVYFTLSFNFDAPKQTNHWKKPVTNF